MILEKLIDQICEHLPEGWRIRIDLEKHSGTVTAIRPDGTEMDMGGDGERDMTEQVGDALHLAYDEQEAKRIFG